MLELYQSEGRPYCETVREKLTDIGQSVVLRNPRTAGSAVRDEQTHAELTAVRGEDQITLLVDTNRTVTLSGSDDVAQGTSASYRTSSDNIVEYLEKHYA